MKKLKPGMVVQISLPNRKFAHGRLYKDVSIAIYTRITDAPSQPPLGSRDFRFNIGIYNDALTSGKCVVVGDDPFRKDEDPWPPPRCIVDPITNECSIYHHGEIKKAPPEECRGLEVAAVWELEHIIDRILNGEESPFLKSVNSDRVAPKSRIQ